MTFLAVLASLFFPGAGHALTGRWKPAVIWAVAGLLPVAATFLWVPLIHGFLIVRVVAAIDAAIRVGRAKPGTNHLTLAGIVTLSSACVLGVVRGVVLEGFRVPAASMAPTLEVNDHIFASKVSTPERGDVVVFWHPTGLQYVKRLIARGGDVVAVRDGVVYVNGTAAARRDLGLAKYWDYEGDLDSWSLKDARAFEESHGGHHYVVYRAPDLGSFHDFPRTDDAFFTAERDPCARTGLFDETEAGTPRPQMKLSADGKGCVVPPGTLFLLGDNRDNSNDSRAWGVVRESAVIGVVLGRWWPASRFGNLD